MATLKALSERVALINRVQNEQLAREFVYSSEFQEFKDRAEAVSLRLEGQVSVNAHHAEIIGNISNAVRINREDVDNLFNRLDARYDSILNVLNTLRNGLDEAMRRLSGAEVMASNTRQLAYGVKDEQERISGFNLIERVASLEADFDSHRRDVSVKLTELIEENIEILEEPSEDVMEQTLINIFKSTTMQEAKDILREFWKRCSDE